YRSHQVTQQMAGKDITLAAVDRTRRINEFACFDGQGRAAYNPGEDRGVNDGNGGDTCSCSRPDNGNDEKRKQDCRKRQKHIHDAHDDTVPPAPKPRRSQSQNSPRKSGNSDCRKAHHEGLRDTSHQAAHDVTSEKVGSHPVGSTWRTQPVYPILHQRIMRREAEIAETSHNQINQNDEPADTAARMSENRTQYLHQLSSRRMRGSSATYRRSTSRLTIMKLKAMKRMLPCTRA